MMLYPYIILLSLIFFMLFYCIKESVFLPIKIRIVITMVILALLSRYFSVFLLFIVTNIKYLYILKTSVFFNIICIPIIGLSMVFIFIRNNKFNYTYIEIFSLVLLVLYLLFMFNFSSVQVSILKKSELGYTMVFDGKYLWIYVIYAIINVGIAIGALRCLINKNVDKNGLIVITVASVITAIEIALILMNILFLPQYLLGEAAWILVMVYAIRKVSKR